MTFCCLCHFVANQHISFYFERNKWCVVVWVGERGKSGRSCEWSEYSVWNFYKKLKWENNIRASRKRRRKWGGGGREREEEEREKRKEKEKRRRETWNCISQFVSAEQSLEQVNPFTYPNKFLSRLPYLAIWSFSSCKGSSHCLFWGAVSASVLLCVFLSLSLLNKRNSFYTHRVASPAYTILYFLSLLFISSLVFPVSEDFLLWECSAQALKTLLI